jgi:hypothetical protein
LPSTTQGLLISTLLDNGWAIYPVNPKTVDRRRNAANAKTDRIDAYLLAKTGCSDLADLRRLTPDNPIGPCTDDINNASTLPSSKCSGSTNFV